MSTAACEGGNKAVFWKPAFIFGNIAPNSNQQLLAREDQWLFKLGEDKNYLPSSKCHFPLSFFRSVTTERKMAWLLNRSTDSVRVGILTAQSHNRSGPPQLVIGLYPGLFGKDVLAGENPMMAWTFLNQFIKADSNYPVTDFRTPGWVHSTKKQWWSQLTSYVLDQFSSKL